MPYIYTYKYMHKYMYIYIYISIYTPPTHIYINEMNDEVVSESSNED